MPHATTILLSVGEAAGVLGITPRTVRRWLQEGHLVGEKIGTTWVVFVPEECQAHDTPTRASLLHRGHSTEPLPIRQRLRQLGHHLITAGNAMAGVQQKRGEVFLTWRRPGSLQIVFAMGRVSPIQQWAPYALGTGLPFWLKERRRWRRVRPLVRRYERIRHWCHPRLLRHPQVHEVVEAEIAQLHAAIEVCATQGHPEHVSLT
jgi:excisionase family DNA binding protein